MGQLLLDAAAAGRLDSPALAAAAAALLAAAASAVDGRLAYCQAALVDTLGAAERGLDRRMEILLVKCLRLRRSSVVKLDESLVQVRGKAVVMGRGLKREITHYGSRRGKGGRFKKGRCSVGH